HSIIAHTQHAVVASDTDRESNQRTGSGFDGKKSRERRVKGIRGQTMELLTLFRDFMDKGGDVLWAILFVAIWLWWTLLERYWYFFAEHQTVKKQAVERWDERSEHKS